MYLFGDEGGNSDVRYLVLSLIVGSIGAAGSYLVQQFWKWRTEKKDDEDQNRKDIVKRQDAYIKRLEGQVETERAEKDKKAAEIVRHIEKHGRCEIAKAKMRAAIREREAALERNKLSYEKWQDEDDSDADGSAAHKPLLPATPQPKKPK